MAQHNEAGKEGERLAAEWLAAAGHRILQQNWRYRHYELDLITVKDGMLHVTEVKWRAANHFGPPETAVNKKKIQSLLQAVSEYLYLNPQWDDFRLDVLSITQRKNGTIEYFLIEDLYL